MVNILQLSDLHYIPRGQLAFRTLNTHKRLDYLAAWLLELKVNINAIVFTGDIFQDTAPDAACAEVGEVFSSYEIYFLPGNHDTATQMECLTHKPSGHNFLRDWPDCRIIGLDTTSGSHYGRLSQDSLAWLEAHIRVDKPVLVFMHHAPIKIYSAFMDNHLDGLAGLREVLEKRISEVRICCGHVHRAVVSVYAGCIVFCCPSLSFELEIDFTETGGNSYVESPALAALHTVDERGAITTQILQIPGSYSWAKHSFI